MINYANTIDRLLGSTRRSLPVWAGMQAGQKVLDVCCGTGAQAAAYTAFGLKATGLDNDSKMLALGSRYITADGPVLLEGDAAALPFETGSFDWVSVSFGLHEKPRELCLAILAEMRRVVTPVGFLVFLDYTVPMPRNGMGLGLRAVERLAGREHFTFFKRYQKSGGLANLLEQTGLKAVNRKRIGRGTLEMVKAGLGLPVS